MLYFNRNGVWFTIPLKKDGVYSRELLEKQIHTSLLSLQNLKDRSPDLEQMRFEKKDEYLVTSVFGRDEIIINPNTIVKKGTKIEKYISKIIKRIPVPVFELFYPGTESVTVDFKKFWVCLTTSWDPKVKINSDITNRENAVIPIYKIGTTTIRPLSEIGIQNLGDSNYDDSLYEDNEYDWDPGNVYLDIRTDFLETVNSGPWLGPNLSDSYWVADGYCLEQCPSPYESLCYNQIGNFQTSSVNATVSLFTWADGSSYYNVPWYAFYIEYGRHHTTHTCAWPGNGIVTDVIEDYSRVDYVYLPMQHKYDTSQQYRNYPVILGNDQVVYEHDPFDYQTRTDYYMEPSLSELRSWAILNDTVTGEDVYFMADSATVGDSGFSDYECWCSVFSIDSYNVTNTYTHDFGGQYLHEFVTDPIVNTTRAAFIVPYTAKVGAKVAGSDELYILWEQDFSDWDDYVDRYGTVEIYNYFGEPVYIISITVWQGSEGVPTIIKYAMIFRGQLYLSDEYDCYITYDRFTYEGFGQVNAENSYGFGLVGKMSARAAAVEYFDEIETEVETEEN